MRSSIAIVAACMALAACGQQPPARTASTTTTTAITAPSHASMQVDACIDTTISTVGSRLDGIPNSGSAVLYANGMSQVSYDAVPGIDHSHAGDAVHLCLVSVPQNCPPGDDRGKVYAATNKRTSETWQAPDSEHSCGGA